MKMCSKTKTFAQLCIYFWDAFPKASLLLSLATYIVDTMVCKAIRETVTPAGEEQYSHMTEYHIRQKSCSWIHM